MALCRIFVFKRIDLSELEGNYTEYLKDVSGDIETGVFVLLDVDILDK